MTLLTYIWNRCHVRNKRKPIVWQWHSKSDMILRWSRQGTRCETAMHTVCRSRNNRVIPCRLTGYIQVSQMTTEYGAAIVQPRRSLFASLWSPYVTGQTIYRGFRAQRFYLKKSKFFRKRVFVFCKFYFVILPTRSGNCILIFTPLESSLKVLSICIFLKLLI